MPTRDSSKAVPTTRDETQVAKRYFESFVSDYHDAFEGRGRNPLHAVINRLFRRKTFQLRTRIVEQWLREFDVAGKRVLDLGCGSGEVSLVAARLGATVTGVDIVPGMVEIARREAAAAGVSDRTSFRVGDLVTTPVDPVAVALLVGVVEYYKAAEDILDTACRAAGGLLIVVDTRGPWWRRQLRYALARLKRFHLYYHAPGTIAALVSARGFTETARVAGHSFTAFRFERRAS